MAFSFGGASNKPLFGTQTTTAGSAFGQSSTFGGASTSTGTGTGMGGFGTGFGTGTTSAGGTGFSFGTGLGTAAPTTSQTGFGFGFNTGTGGTANTNAGTGFGTGTGFNFGGGLGATAVTSSTGFGGFNLGGTSAAPGLAGIGTQQQVQQAPQGLDAVATAVIMPVVFGDERDAVIMKWNQLQAYWGSGRGFYNNSGHSTTFNAENPFCRFKAVGYSVLPTYRNKDGLLALFFRNKAVDVENKQTQLVDGLHKILGSKPNMSVCVEGVKELPYHRCEMQIYVQERLPTGTTRRIPASEVFTFMSQQNISSQLQSQLHIENILPKTGMSKDALKNYLDNPPAGIDPLIWQQAKLDNPDPEKFIPVPMVGFMELHGRLKHQENQTKLHQARLDVITSDIATLQLNHANMLAKTDEYKRRHLELSHRVLQVLVKQEISRKMGYAIQGDEEQLLTQLQALQSELNAPTQFKGRLNELMSQIRMQNQLGAGRTEASYQMDEPVQLEIKQHLKQQQDGLQHLISIIKDDLEDLKLIEQGLGDAHRH